VLPGRDADPSPPSSARGLKLSRAISILSLRAFVDCERGETIVMRIILLVKTTINSALVAG